MIGTKAQQPAKVHRDYSLVILKVVVAMLLLVALFTRSWLGGAMIVLSFALSRLIFY